MSAPRTLLVDADLTLRSGSTVLRVRGAGERVEVHVARWRDALSLRGHRGTAGCVRELAARAGVGIDLFVRGIRIPSWLAS